MFRSSSEIAGEPVTLVGAPAAEKCGSATVHLVHNTKLTRGIAPCEEFGRKSLRAFAVNLGTKCGHECLYCSSGAVMWMHRPFKRAGEGPFGSGYAIVDPRTPERVAADARSKRGRGRVQVCTTVDAQAPEAKRHELGRRCLLEAVLGEPRLWMGLPTRTRPSPSTSIYRHTISADDLGSACTCW